MLFLFYLVLAFTELSLLRSHFRPFTEVMRKGGREVTKKTQRTADQTEIANELDDPGGRLVGPAFVVIVRPVD
jgi:hypothetical protein